MKHIEYVFFDLDHTLWDFERCSMETLGELFAAYSGKFGTEVTFEQFLSSYHRNNRMLWQRYERNEVKPEEVRHQRWVNTFRDLEVDAEGWLEQIGAEYLDLCPRKPHLVSGAREILTYLAGNYEVHMITNGWSDSQHLKLSHSGIADCFGEVITSDRADATKPNRKIFDYALAETGAVREKCLYVGDNYESDVLGGMNAGWEVVFFNPGALENPVMAPQVKELMELSSLL